MKYIRLFESFINEASTLSRLGLTGKQLTAIHNGVTGGGRDGGSGALSHDSKWENVKNKSELSKILQREEGSSPAVIFKMSDGTVKVMTLFYHSDNKAKKYKHQWDWSHFDMDGTVIPHADKDTTWVEGYSLSGALAQIKGKIDEIYYSLDASLRIKSAKGDYKRSVIFKDAKDQTNFINLHIEGTVRAYFTKFKDQHKRYQDEIAKLAKDLAKVEPGPHDNPQSRFIVLDNREDYLLLLTHDRTHINKEKPFPLFSFKQGFLNRPIDLKAKDEEYVDALLYNIAYDVQYDFFSDRRLATSKIPEVEELLKRIAHSNREDTDAEAELVKLMIQHARMECKDMMDRLKEKYDAIIGIAKDLIKRAKDNPDKPTRFTDKEIQRLYELGGRRTIRRDDLEKL